jgi:hypothetical protein
VRIRVLGATLLAAGLAGCASTVTSPPVQPQVQPIAVQPSAPVTLDSFRPCLAIDDMTKERLDCYDAIVPPEPRTPPPRATTIVECRFVREEDARLRCFNGFLVEQRVATRPPRTGAAPPPAIRRTATTKRYVRKGRGGCGSRGGPGYRLPSGKCASHRR